MGGDRKNRTGAYMGVEDAELTSAAFSVQCGALFGALNGHWGTIYYKNLINVLAKKARFNAGLRVLV